MIKIFFNELLKNYDKNLITKLRGFGKEEEYLKYWVPGTSKFNSLENLIDALHEGKIFDFQIFIDKTDSEICDQILKKKDRIGHIEKIIKNNEIILTFNLTTYNLKTKIPQERKKIAPLKKNYFPQVKKIERVTQKKLINEEYLKKIQSLNYKNFKNGKAEQKTNCRLYARTLFNHTISVLINEKSHIVEKAYHNFKELKDEHIVVDIFLDQILNKHIQEISEHSVIYLEHYLRPDNLTQKIKGITLPFHAGYLFENLNDLIRDVYREFKLDFRFKEKINKDFTEMSASWKKMKMESKEKLIVNTLASSVSKQLNIDKKEIVFKKLEMDFRIFIEIGENLKKRQQTENVLFKIENILNNEIDQRIELFTTELIDQNILRIKNSPQKLS